MQNAGVPDTANCIAGEMRIAGFWDTSEMQISGEMWIVGVRDTSQTQNADVRNEIETKIKYMNKVNLGL